jgi:C-terminal processing protease CtpA/Prc
VVITNAKNDNQKYEILFRRDPSEKPKTVSLEPAPLDFTTGYIRLMQQESRVDVIDSQNIGYLRLPGMRKDFLNTFKNSWQKLGSKLDALVLDFRRGLPGRDSGFLPLFFTDPDASNHLPLPDTVTILIDEGTQEGLEWIAALLRKEKKVHLIGSASAGQLRESTSLTLKSGPYRLQVLKGDPDELRGLIPDQPLQPDYLVEAPLVYAHGVDEVRRKAIQKTAEWAGK